MQYRKLRKSKNGQRISTCLRSYQVKKIDWHIVNDTLRYARRVSLADDRRPIDIAISFFEEHGGDLQAVKTKMSTKFTQRDRDRYLVYTNQMKQVFVELKNRGILIDENVHYIVLDMLSNECRNIEKVNRRKKHKFLSADQLSNVLAKVLKKMKLEDAVTDTTAPSSNYDEDSLKEPRQLLRDVEEVCNSDHAEALVIDVTTNEDDRIVKSIPRPTTKTTELDTAASSSQNSKHEHRERDTWRPNFENQRHEDAQVAQVLSKLRSYGIATDQTIIRDARIMMRDELRLASRALSTDKLSPDQQVLRTAAIIWENFTYPRTISDAEANPMDSSIVSHVTMPPSVASPNQRTLPWIVPDSEHVLEQMHRENSRNVRFSVSNDGVSNISSEFGSRSSMLEVQQKEKVAALCSPPYKNIHWIHVSADHIESEVDDDYIPEDHKPPSPQGVKNSTPKQIEGMAADSDNRGFSESDEESARNLMATAQHTYHTHKSNKQKGKQRVVAGILTKTVRDPARPSEDLLYPVYDVQSSVPPSFATFISDFRRINSGKTWINRSTITSLWEELLMTEFLYSHVQARVKVDEEVYNYLKAEARVFGDWLFPKIDVEDGLNIGNIDAYHCTFQKEFLILNPLSHPLPPKGAWTTFKTFNKDRIRDRRLFTKVLQKRENDSSDITADHESQLEEGFFKRSQEHINDKSFHKTHSGPLEALQHEHSELSSSEEVDSVVHHHLTSEILNKPRAMRELGRLQTRDSVKSELMDLGREGALLPHTRAQVSEIASALFDTPPHTHEKPSGPSGSKRKRTEQKDVEDRHQESLVDEEFSGNSSKKKTKLKKQEGKRMNGGSSIALRKVSNTVKKKRKIAQSDSSESTPSICPAHTTPQKTARRLPSPSKWSHIPVPKTLRPVTAQAMTSKAGVARESQKAEPFSSTKCPPCPKDTDEDSDESIDSSGNDSEEPNEDAFIKQDKPTKNSLLEFVIKIEDDSDRFFNSDKSDTENEPEEDNSSNNSKGECESDSDNSSTKTPSNHIGKASDSRGKVTKVVEPNATVARTKSATKKAVKKPAKEPAKEPAAKKSTTKKATSSKVKKVIKKPVEDEVEKGEKTEPAKIDKLKRKKIVEGDAEVETQTIQLSDLIEARNKIELQISELLKNQSPATSFQQQAGTQSSPIAPERKTKKAMDAKETKSKGSRKSSG